MSQIQDDLILTVVGRVALIASGRLGKLRFLSPKLRLREVKSIYQGDINVSWHGWDLNPDLFDSHASHNALPTPTSSITRVNSTAQQP